MLGIAELEVMLCIVRFFNVHVGVAGPVKRNVVVNLVGERGIEGQELVEPVARNGMAIAGSFFQKRESHEITYRSGQQRTELDLVVVRKRQLWRESMLPPSTSL